MNPAPSTTRMRSEPSRSGRWARLKLWLGKFRHVPGLYLLMLPTLLGTVVFNYWPKVDVFRYAFFRWEPKVIEDYIGFKNFTDAFHDTRFHAAFMLVGLLLAANLVKMLPSMITAIVLHRVKSDRARYIFQIGFVIPMVIPGLVWLLLWKGFMDPNVGLINALLNATGLMEVLAWLDGVMFRVADALYPVVWALDHLFSGSGSAFLTQMPEAGVARTGSLGLWGLVMGGAYLLLFQGGPRKLLDRWVLVLLVLIPAIAIWRDRAFILLPLLGTAAVFLRRDQLGGFAGDRRLQWTGLGVILAGALLLLLTKVWTTRIGVFDSGAPAWLGHSKLLIPAVIFWGFPWVHAVGILIYLAGLQQIPTDVYEAAELDGLGSFGKAIYIELPLILAQVRINLIFMTIGTLNEYGFFLILLGPEGGPGGKGMVPGLYMFQQAFVQNKFGYTCALGLILFVVILTLTMIYQRYVRVEK